MIPPCPPPARGWPTVTRRGDIDLDFDLGNLEETGAAVAVTLFRPDVDVWEPGEHNGTFRGYNPAFVTATAALRTYWTDDTLQKSTLAKGERIGEVLTTLADRHTGVTARGRGLARGLAFEQGELARKVCTAAFERGLLVETAGPSGEVAKLMPPLTISDEDLDEGLVTFADAVGAIC